MFKENEFTVKVAPPCHIAISNLEQHLTEERLQEIFSSFGTIKSVLIGVGKETHLKYASIEYEAHAAAKGAAEGMAEDFSIRLDPKGV